MAPHHLTTALLTGAVAVAHGFTSLARTPGQSPVAAGWAGRGGAAALRTPLGADVDRRAGRGRGRGRALSVLEIDETSSGERACATPFLPAARPRLPRAV